jgi:hypothetical protein
MERDTLSTLQAQAANQSKEQEKLVTDIIIIINSSQFGNQYKEVSIEPSSCYMKPARTQSSVIDVLHQQTTAEEAGHKI